MVLTPKHEIITGSNLTGSSGDTNRIYELNNDDAILAQMQVIVSENIQQSSVNFSFDTSTNAITFLGVILDAQPITIDYFISR